MAIPEPLNQFFNNRELNKKEETPTPEDPSQLKARMEKLKPINPELSRQESIANSERLLKDAGCFCSDRLDGLNKIKTAVAQLPFLMWQSKTKTDSYGVIYPNKPEPRLVHKDNINKLIERCQKHLGEEFLDTLKIFRDEGCLCDTEQQARKKLFEGFPYALWPDEEKHGYYHTILVEKPGVTYSTAFSFLPRFLQDHPITKRRFPEARMVSTPIIPKGMDNPKKTQDDLSQEIINFLEFIGCYCNNQKEAEIKMLKGKHSFVVFPDEAGDVKILFQNTTPQNISVGSLLKVIEQGGTDLLPTFTLLEEKGSLCRDKEEAERKRGENPDIPLFIWPTEKPGTFGVLGGDSDLVLLADIPKLVQDKFF